MNIIYCVNTKYVNKNCLKVLQVLSSRASSGKHVNTQALRDLYAKLFQVKTTQYTCLHIFQIGVIGRRNLFYFLCGTNKWKMLDCTT